MGESLTIRTGKMGHGKTLNAIREIDAEAKKQERIVYYHNIDELQPDKLQAAWYNFDDPHKWYELPDNCIIVIDEAQRFFGIRDPRQPVPPYISALETIRHQGQEIVFITQDHRFLDVNIRRLCGCHIHFKRVLGSQKLVRYEFLEASDYDKVSVLANADKTYVQIDKRLFGVYKSASTHHFKIKIPKKMYLFIGLIFVALYLGYYVFSSLASKSEQTEDHKNNTVSKPLSVGSVVDNVVNRGKDTKKDHPMTLEEYLIYYTPRIMDFPHTAPAYDKLTEPQSYPRLSCLITESASFIKNNKDRIATKKINGVLTGCSCYTQQSSLYKVSFDACQNIVENGYFDSAKPDFTNDKILKGRDSLVLGKK